jgi:hypothetical protein
VSTLEADYLRAIESGADGLADWYGAQLDAPCLERQERQADPGLLGEAAAWYAQQGFHVFPLCPGSKVPLPRRLTCCGGSHQRGCLDALDDVTAARAWWAEHPTANIGLATGHLVDVIDQDGAAGAVWWLRGQDWPAVLGVVLTPRAGGVHRYVRATGRGNGQRIAPGLDYRGRGGYVVAPPSQVDGKRYQWVVPVRLT